MFSILCYPPFDLAACYDPTTIDHEFPELPCLIPDAIDALLADIYIYLAP